MSTGHRSCPRREVGILDLGYFQCQGMEVSVVALDDLQELSLKGLCVVLTDNGPLLRMCLLIRNSLWHDRCLSSGAVGIRIRKLRVELVHNFGHLHHIIFTDTPML